MAIFKHFAKAIYSEANLPKITDFVDELEIDKIRSTAEIFPFMAKFDLDGLMKSFWINCIEETA